MPMYPLKKYVYRSVYRYAYIFKYVHVYTEPKTKQNDRKQTGKRCGRPFAACWDDLKFQPPKYMLEFTSTISLGIYM